jgi:SHOCT-like protein
MPEELDTILRLVAEGKLTPEEAAPIIDALSSASRSRHAAAFATDRIHRHLEHAQDRVDDAFARAGDRLDAPSGGRRLRIRVTERGRQVVNLRIPIGFVDAALRFVPGLGGEQADRIRDAVNAGAIGPILDVEDPDGEGGVLISVE